jgi:aspartyl-tRNA synthetase
MERTYIGDAGQKTGKTILIKGWVDVRRDQGKMVFFDFRDMTGMIQGVVLPNRAEVIEIAKTARPECVVAVEGIVNKRPEKNVVADKQNGDIELEITAITILNNAEPLPFEVNVDTKDVNEEVRLKHRYLDLRSSRMQRNIRMRDAVIDHARRYLHDEKFIEVETPILTRSTPEGAPRLYRSFPSVSRQFLCAPAVSAAIQAAPYVRGHGAILPDRQVHA